MFHHCTFLDFSCGLRPHCSPLDKFQFENTFISCYFDVIAKVIVAIHSNARLFLLLQVMALHACHLQCYEFHNGQSLVMILFFDYLVVELS